MQTKLKKLSKKNDDYQWIPIDDPSLVFTTFDLGLSTALLCVGFQLLSIDKDNPQKSMFIFQKEDGIEQIIDEYFSDRLEIKARSFFDTLKALKNKLYSI